MQQTPIAFDPTPDIATRDREGFEIGWDHAHFGLVPPPGLLLEGTPIGQGWRAARVVFTGRTLTPTRHTRAWLALRIQAWREGVPLQLQTVTPNHLAQIEVATCPVRRCRLGGAADSGDAPARMRLNARAAYAAGNLAVVSQAAAQAVRGVDVAEAVRRANEAELTGAPVAGLEAAQWWRWAALAALATPLPEHQAARLPLAALPPNRTRVLNHLQALQVLVTLRFTGPPWARGLAEVASLLPDHTLRTDFNLFVGALAPRVLEAQAHGRDLREALEDAWLAERVQRRWLHFASSLSAPLAEALVRKVSAWPLPGRSAIFLGAAEAVDGWALCAEDRGTTSAALGTRTALAAPTVPAMPPSGARAPEQGEPVPLAAGAQHALHPDRRRTARTPSRPPTRESAARPNAAR
jgi:hypothetical protein